MSRHLYFDGQTLSESEPVTLQLTAALLYGKGIFTTAAIRDGRPWLWDKHWRRLERSADRLGIDLSEHSERSTAEALHNLVSTDQVLCGRARLTFFDLRSSSLWPVKTNQKTALAIAITENRAVTEDFRLTFSPYPINSRSPLAGVKSCNYLENILAIDEARDRGFHEAVRVNERGHITSGCMANVFWLKQNRLFTPSLSTGCLPGTTREFVLENIECEEVEAGIDELNSADAIFLTSAGLGIVEAAEYGSTQFNRSDHPILDLLNDLY